MSLFNLHKQVGPNHTNLSAILLDSQSKASVLANATLKLQHSCSSKSWKIPGKILQKTTLVGSTSCSLCLLLHTIRKALGSTSTSLAPLGGLLQRFLQDLDLRGICQQQPQRVLQDPRRKLRLQPSSRDEKQSSALSLRPGRDSFRVIRNWSFWSPETFQVPFFR